MRRLLVFLKYPEPGHVKTRLAASIGAEAAAKVARMCAEATLRQLGVFRKDATLLMDPPEALERARMWLGSTWRMQPQQGTTLGERLAHATAAAFAEGARRVVVIGSDSPWIAPRDIEAAFTALRQADVVLGPTEDGGYYLIGLSRDIPAIFSDVAWSTPAVYAQTIAKARALGLPVQELPRGYDIDRPEDLERFLGKEAPCLS